MMVHLAIADFLQLVCEALRGLIAREVSIVGFLTQRARREGAENAELNTVLAAIPGGCPMMFCKSADFAHTCMRWVRKLTQRTTGAKVKHSRLSAGDGVVEA